LGDTALEGNRMILSMRKYGIAAAAGLAVAASAFGQTSAKPAQTASQPTTSVTTAHDTSSGMATGRREAASGHASGQNAKSSAHATEVIEYKDGEDMTTRTRPGTSKTAAAGTTTPAAPAEQPAATPKKQVAGVKYEDRQVTLPACDGTSKDSAKCAATPSASPSTHVNKVESISIKQ